jgi:hypothetical protein
MKKTDVLNRSSLKCVVLLIFLIQGLSIELFSFPRQETVTVSGRVSLSAAGEISGLMGVRMVFTSSSGESHAIITRLNGAFSHTLPKGWIGTIQALKVSYAFKPSVLTLYDLQEDLEGQNFSATRGNTVDISGYIYEETGAPLEGVLIQAFDSLLHFPGEAVISNSDGLYQLPVGSGWTGNVHAFKDGYQIDSLIYQSPVETNLENRNYTAIKHPLAISGRIQSINATGIRDVQVTFNGNTGAVTQSDFNGNYNQQVPHGWSGTVTLSKPGCYFEAVEYPPLSMNQTFQDYVAEVEESYPVISGRLTDASGSPVAGVTMTFSQKGGTTGTDNNGSYYHPVPRGWSGSVVPNKTGHTFLPPSRQYTNLRTPRPAQDYKVTRNLPVISGRVLDLFGDKGIAGVRIDFLPQEDLYTYTDKEGYYSCTVPIGWTGTGVPSSPGYLFSPPREYQPVNGSQSQQDYQVTGMFPVISGIVTRIKAGADGKRELPGVTLTFTNGGGFTYSRDNGYFIRPVYFGWTGDMVLEKEGFVFLPAVLRYAGVYSHLYGQNVVAIPGTIDLEMQVERKISGSLTIQRNYAFIEVSFQVRDIDTNNLSHMVISRKASGTTYREIREIKIKDMPAGGKLNHIDLELQADTIYTYKVTLYAAGGEIIKETAAKEI